MFEINKIALEAYTHDGQAVGPRLISREASYLNFFLDARNLPEDPADFPGEVHVDIDYVRVF